MTHISEKNRREIFAKLEQVASQYNNKDIDSLILNFDPDFTGIIGLKRIEGREQVKNILVIHFEGIKKSILRFTDIRLVSLESKVLILVKSTLWRTDGEEINENSYQMTIIMQQSDLVWSIIYLHV